MTIQTFFFLPILPMKSFSYIYSCVRRWFANEDDTCEKDPVDTRRLHSIIVGRVKEQQRNV